MKPGFVFKLLIAILIFLASLFIFLNIDTRKKIDVLYGKDSLTLVKLSVISSPYLAGKKDFTLNDKKLLGSMDTLFKKFNVPVDVQVAKSNNAYIIIELYRGNKRNTVEIVNSVYTGWVVIAGTKCFRNDHIVQFIQPYLK
jgi:hypothetical protein